MGALPLHRSEAESRRRWKFGLFAACLVWGGWRRHRRALPDATAGRVAAQGDSSKLDLVFTLDVTGSMGAYIDGAKENIEAITERLVSRDGQRFDGSRGVRRRRHARGRGHGPRQRPAAVLILRYFDRKNDE